MKDTRGTHSSKGELRWLFKCSAYAFGLGVPSLPSSLHDRRCAQMQPELCCICALNPMLQQPYALHTVIKPNLEMEAREAKSVCQGCQEGQPSTYTCVLHAEMGFGEGQICACCYACCVSDKSLKLSPCSSVLTCKVRRQNLGDWFESKERVHSIWPGARRWNQLTVSSFLCSLKNVHLSI